MIRYAALVFLVLLSSHALGRDLSGYGMVFAPASKSRCTGSCDYFARDSGPAGDGIGIEYMLTEHVGLAADLYIARNIRGNALSVSWTGDGFRFAAGPAWITMDAYSVFGDSHKTQYHSAKSTGIFLEADYKYAFFRTTIFAEEHAVTSLRVTGTDAAGNDVFGDESTARVRYEKALFFAGVRIPFAD